MISCFCISKPVHILNVIRIHKDYRRISAAPVKACQSTAVDKEQLSRLTYP
jgi:hypothetical protein